MRAGAGSLQGLVWKQGETQEERIQYNEYKKPGKSLLHLLISLLLRGASMTPLVPLPRPVILAHV